MCRLILSKAGLRDRLAVYYTCRPLHHLLASEPGPGFWGQVAIHVSAQRAPGPNLKRIVSQLDVGVVPSSYTPSIVVQLCAADSPRDRAAVIDWVLERIRGVSSLRVEIWACEGTGIPASAVLRLWAGVASQIGALPSLPPLTLCYSSDRGGAEATRRCLDPFLNTLGLFTRAPNTLCLDLSGCQLDTAACNCIAALSHLPCIRLDGFADMAKPDAGVPALSQALECLAPLTNLHLGIGTDQAGSRFADSLMKLTGLRSLDMMISHSCRFPAGFADALSHVTHISVGPTANGFGYEAASDLIDRFESVTSASITYTYSLDSADSIPLLISRLPVNVSTLSIDIVGGTSKLRGPHSHIKLDIASDAVSNILASSRLTSLELHFGWVFLPGENFPEQGSFDRSILVDLGESFGRLSSLKSLRVLLT